METLQFIGLITLAYLAYRYLYLPYVNKKKKQTEEIEKKIGILSHFQKDMRELFNPYANYVERKDDDDKYSISYGGWIKLYGRTLHFSSDNEILDFKKKALQVYNNLNTDEFERAQIENIFTEHEQKQNETFRKKEIMYLSFRKNFLEYDTLLKQILPDYKVVLSKQEIISFLEKELNKSNSDAEAIFNNLSDKNTGLLSPHERGWLDKYRYFGETTIEIRLKQL
ncbi:MAG: hypothetical protein ABI691_11105 [Ginsengibacter sp.]